MNRMNNGNDCRRFARPEIYYIHLYSTQYCMLHLWVLLLCNHDKVTLKGTKYCKFS